MMPTQGSLRIERMCRLPQVSWAGFYRSLREQTPSEEEMELRSVIRIDLDVLSSDPLMSTSERAQNI